MQGRTIDQVIEERCQADPVFAADWDAQQVAREFAIAVIGFRVDHGLSQDGLAAALWVEPHTIRHLEIGEEPQ